MVMSVGITCRVCQEIMPFACPMLPLVHLTYALDSQENGPSGSDPCKWVRQRVDVDRGSMVVTG
jgi:hypothetical protein